VVSLGLDAAETDPESPLRVTEVGYRAAGRLTAALAPTVLIQERPRPKDLEIQFDSY
jgi:hypothetical protein